MSNYKFFVPPVVFALLALFIGIYTDDCYRVTRFLSVGKYMGNYIIPPEELIMLLKDEDIQKKVLTNLDINDQIDFGNAKKILSNARFYRSKYIGFTADAVTEEDASKLAESLSNAVSSYVNSNLNIKNESSKHELIFLGISIANINKLIGLCNVNITCKKNNEMLLIFKQSRERLAFEQNVLRLNLQDEKTFPSKTLTNIKEVNYKSRDSAILMILLSASYGLFLSLILYLKKLNHS